VLSSSKLWRRVVEEVARDYPDVALDHLYVDAAAMALIMAPRRFDVILTENMFGDILSDEMSALAGSIGLLPSASVGTGGPGLFEPIHGSAPDLAGLDTVNPAGAIASAAMLLDIGLGLREAAMMLEDALETVLRGGCWTADLGGNARCSEFGAKVREELAYRLTARDAHLELVAMNRGTCG
jgi:3-isopropylmalate dehydrogenase